MGARNVLVPIEVIALIGEKLLKRGVWSKTYNVAQAEAARKQAAKWQAEAAAILLKNPKLSLTAAARLIAPDNCDYVRQLISKPTK